MGEHPKWLRKREKRNKGNFKAMKHTIKEHDLHTVCQEAKCPNCNECWGTGSVTFMILGDACTRSCNFCAVNSKPLRPPDPQEPVRLAKAVKEIDLEYVVLTSVTRDDLSDYGAGHYADCVTTIKEENPGVIVEALIPDLQGSQEYLEKIVHAQPEVIGHNVETVERLQESVRDPRAGYEQSLNVLKNVKQMNPDIYTKSSLMLGLGETKEEVLQVMDDLRAVHVDILTLGQYLQPSKDHLEVKDYISPEQFKFYKEKALEKGFAYAATGTFVRSSYKSAEYFTKNMIRGAD